MKPELEAICLNHRLKLLNYETVHGGDINQAYKIRTLDGIFFIKLNDAALYPGMLEAEAKGLELISMTQSFMVPKIIASGQKGLLQYLLLEWIPQGMPQQGFWENFGAKLAQLHGHTRYSFGLDFDNYIGSLTQRNTDEKSFATFYAQHRIMPLVEKLFSRGDFNKHHLKQFESFCRLFPELIQEEPPSLLHGDLWAGNYLVHENGLQVVIDPAPYFGHREMDLAMTKLFGGFDREMYSAYYHHYPLAPGWENRIPLFQLYPLLVHAVLFGGGYCQRCLETVYRFS